MGTLRDPSTINNVGTLGGATNPTTAQALPLERENQKAIRELVGTFGYEDLTISSGGITPTKAEVTVDTEAGASADDLTTIYLVSDGTTTLHDGMLLKIRAYDPARTVTVKHGSGTNQIQTLSGTDIVLGTTWELTLKLQSGVWKEVRGRQDITGNAATATDLANGSVLSVAKGGTGASTAAAALTNLGVQNFPVGTIFDFPVATPPTGALVCDGSTRSRTAYAALYAVIGTTYGAGDGSTTFNLPDLRGEFRRGADLGRGVDAGRAVGSAQGDLAKVAIATRRSDATINVVPSWWNNATRLSPGCDYASSIDSTQTHGGSETRPRNIAVVPCIKY